MAVPSPSGPQERSPAAAQLQQEDEVRHGIELLYFGYTRLTKSIDDMLASEGLGRAHHRALYFIARQPGLTISDLLRLLAVTKQSLGRVLNDMSRRGLITTTPGTTDKRQKLLWLTDKGAALEARLFAALRRRVAAAYDSAGPQSVTGFWRVLEGLVPIEDRPMVSALREVEE